MKDKSKRVVDTVTTEEMLKKLNTAKDSPFFKIYGMIDENDYSGAIQCIKEYFGCEEDLAKIVCMDFKVEFYDPDQKLLKETISKLSPAEIAHVNAEARALLNKPKCPTCNSSNLKKISLTSKAVNTAVFGIFGTKRHKQFHCNNCGYEW